MEKGYHNIEIDRLVKAGWNYKENNDALMEKLINNIKRNGQIENIIIRELDTGFFEVVNGNHRLDALNAIGSKTVYCYNLGQISEAQAKRIAIETNETKFQSSEESLAEILREIIDEFDDFDVTSPFSEEELNELLADIDENIGGEHESEEPENPYTQKIEVPIYEPKNEKPKPAELRDKNKQKELLDEIWKAEIDEDVRAFLVDAASRHIVFDYAKIADFYAHSDKEIQELMERSGLIIIDFDKAIENGYVKISKEIADLAGEDYGNEG